MELFDDYEDNYPRGDKTNDESFFKKPQPQLETNTNSVNIQIITNPKNLNRSRTGKQRTDFNSKINNNYRVKKTSLNESFS